MNVDFSSYAAPSSFNSSETKEEKRQRKLAGLVELYPYLAPTDENLEIEIQDQRHKIADFVRKLEQYAQKYLQAVRHLGVFPAIGTGDPSATFKEKLKAPALIIDQVIPPYVPLLALALKPKRYKKSIPLPGDIESSYKHLEMLRQTFLRKILNSQSPFPFKIKKIDYSLYHYHTLVATIVRNQLTIYHQTLFDHYMHTYTDQSESRIITPERIEEAIAFGVVPEKNRAELMKWVGKDLQDVLIYDLSVYGNLKRSQKINEEEIHAAKVQHFASSAYFLHERYASHKMTIYTPVRDFKNIRYAMIPLVKRVYKYLLGRRNLEELGITAANAMEILTVVKTIVWKLSERNCMSRRAFSFPEGREIRLRSALFKVLPHDLAYQALLRTLNEENMRDPRQWAVSKSWVAERAAQQGHLVASMHIAASFLTRSGRFQEILGMRGNSASAKSSYMRFLIHCLYGIMSPDILKKFLQYSPEEFIAFLNKSSGNEETRSTGDKMALCTQIHLEGTRLLQQILDAFNNDLKTQYVLDTRLLEVGRVQELLKQGRDVIIEDLENPSLTCSLLRMLTRPAFDDDPSQPTSIIVEGYLKAIKCRNDVIALVKSTRTIKEYNLFFNHRLVAQKKHGEWVVRDPELFKQCTQLPLDVDMRIAEETAQVVTEELLIHALLQGYIYASQIDLLFPWIGIPLGLAVDLNAKGQLPSKKAHEPLRKVLNLKSASARLDLEAQMHAAEQTGNSLVLYDLHSSSLTHALLQMLTRPTVDEEPSQSQAAVVQGYRQAILSRGELLPWIQSKEIVAQYQLFLDGQRVAEKKDQTWIEYSPELFEKCTVLPNCIEDCIQEQTSQIINEEFLADALQRGWIHDSQMHWLLRWVGMPLGMAVDQNSRGEERMILNLRDSSAERDLEALIRSNTEKGIPVVLHDSETTMLAPFLLQTLLKPTIEENLEHSLSALLGKYRQAILSRDRILSFIRSQEIVKEYRLLLDNTLVAEKRGLEWIVHQPEMLERCVMVPTGFEEQIEREISQEITDEFLTHAFQRGWINKPQRQILERFWKNRPLGQAVDTNAHGSSCSSSYSG